MIPQLDARGLLPAGCHVGTWAEIEEAFATNDWRRRRIAQFKLFVRNELQPVAAGLELVLGGSYFSDKPDPGDIDCTVAVAPVDLLQRADLLALSMDGGKGRLWEKYKAEFYVTIVIPGRNDFRLYFQYVGEKTAGLKNLSVTDLRGTVKVEPWILG